MGASLSTQATPTVKAEATMASPPQGCPMHQEAREVKGTIKESSLELLTIELSFHLFTYLPTYCYSPFNMSFCSVSLCLPSVSTFRVSHASGTVS